MTREEIVKSLRICAANSSHCIECAIGFKLGCFDRLMKVAADMLESDATDNNVATKSADEMFRELGYKKTNHNYFADVTLYVDKSAECKIAICHKSKTIHKTIRVCDEYENMDLTLDEIKAISKLIEEMEEK